jgi:high-affinity iron transporter
MLVPFLIMLREGIEAALTVGIIGSYLRQTGNVQLMKPVWLGVTLAIVLCFGLGVILKATSSDFPQKQQELFAAIIALVAVGVLSWMVLWMKRAARAMKTEIQASIDKAVATGDRWGMTLVGMAFFATAREGLESVFFLLATFEQNVGMQAPIGAILGLITSVAIGFGIYQGGIRVNLQQFFRWTGLFILFVAAGLLASAFRAAHEAGVWNLFQDTVFDASNILPTNGLLGTVLAGILGYSDTPTVTEVVAYFGYLIPMLFLFFSTNKTSKPAASS